jgi:hypothetical protein
LKESRILDTREKIVALEDLPARLGTGQWLAVVGRFDPLTLPQAQRIAKLGGDGRAILGVVEPGEDCLLPAEARATLVAALRAVQLVVISEAGSLPADAHMEIVADEEGERKRSAEFVEFIAKRQEAR